LPYDTLVRTSPAHQSSRRNGEGRPPCSCHYYACNAGVVAAQKDPSAPSATKQSLNPTSGVCTNRSLPLTVLRVRCSKRCSLCSAFRGSSVKLHECFLKTTNLSTKSSACSNCTLSLCDSRSQHAVVRRMRGGSGR
jgi:hypothetical protein